MNLSGTWDLKLHPHPPVGSGLHARMPNQRGAYSPCLPTKPSSLAGCWWSQKSLPHVTFLFLWLTWWIWRLRIQLALGTQWTINHLLPMCMLVDCMCWLPWWPGHWSVQCTVNTRGKRTFSCAVGSTIPQASRINGSEQIYHALQMMWIETWKHISTGVSTGRENRTWRRSMEHKK